MSYQVLARKWRPQSFEEVVGQETVTRTLRNAITSDRIAHAFLFSGVRGVGKTTTARILAKALNCQEGPTVSPCGECASCQEIAAASSVDVLEIDAASNTGVDNIRDLRDSARYGTARDRFKVFIIDEVHMLSNQAFNALLKTLEEPPSHVKFILATTEIQKIPETIISRCQQFDFRPISFSLLLDRLKMICTEEHLLISDYALQAIVSTAQGSMRDAQSALDQIIAFSGKEIRDEDVRTLLGVVDEQEVIALVDAVLEQQAETLVEQVQALANSGVDPQGFCRKLVEHVRNLMICRVTGWDEKLLNLPDSQKEAILKQAQRLSELDLIRYYDVLNQAENELRWHSHPFVHLEMTLMKLVELARLPTVEKVINDLKSGQPSEGLEKEAEKKGETSLFKIEKQEPPKKGRQKKKVEKLREAVTAEKPKSVPESIVQLLSAVQVESMGLYASLQHASQSTLEDGKLTLVFPKDEDFHCGVIKESAHQERLVRLCEKITGSRTEIEVRLEGSGKRRSADPTQDPKVKSFIETFPGKVIVEKEIED